MSSFLSATTTPIIKAPNSTVMCLEVTSRCRLFIDQNESMVDRLSWVLYYGGSGVFSYLAGLVKKDKHVGSCWRKTKKTQTYKKRGGLSILSVFFGGASRLLPGFQYVSIQQTRQLGWPQIHLTRTSNNVMSAAQDRRVARHLKSSKSHGCRPQWLRIFNQSNNSCTLNYLTKLRLMGNKFSLPVNLARTERASLKTPSWIICWASKTTSQRTTQWYTTNDGPIELWATRLRYQKLLGFA